MSDNKYRVVVVGAGMAGLAAADALLALGQFSVEDLCVLEAQSRIGGRIHTRTFSDELSVKVEVGAAWIHGTEGNPFVGLARKFGIELKQISARNPWLHPSSCPNFLLYVGDRQLTDEEVEQTWKWQGLLLRKLQKLALSGSVQDKALDAVVEQLLKDDTELREVVTSTANARDRLLLCLHLIETWMGSTSDEMQVDIFGEIDLMGDDPGAHCIVPTGMTSFVDHLSAPIKNVIRTGTCVTTINYESKDAVVIECTDGHSVTADHVVVTCSLGFLKSGKLHFQPDLPVVKADALTRSQMGQCMKVLVQFPEAFWPENATFIGLINGNSRPDESEARRVYFPVVFSYYAAKGIPILEGDLVGDQVRVMSATLSDVEFVQALFQQLQDTFGPDIPEPMGHFITRWDQDKWAMGAYSSVTVDSSYEDPDLLRDTIEHRPINTSSIHRCMINSDGSFGFNFGFGFDHDFDYYDGVFDLRYGQIGHLTDVFCNNLIHLDVCRVSYPFLESCFDSKNVVCVNWDCDYGYSYGCEKF
ncbi:hypothetical protein BBP00_00000346 [Phytophthora kernoviae]|uniref:Amine oxidase domain-containing protein n=1 Tax=Phytophthora kernoviae TaxID=325452 RepID=A0A3F2S4R7_9STRA|nr:hypothetical protein BBP00_00000346 [Phytophthora kernoviae]